MSDRPDDARADDAAGPAGDGSGASEAAPSNEAERRTDGDRWQASVASWSPGDGEAPAESTREIRIDGGAGEQSRPAPDQSSSWQQPSWEQPSWEQSGRQPTTPEPQAWGARADDRSWEQASRDQIASWQQPPSWQQAAEAEGSSTSRSWEAPAPDAPAPQPTWRPAEQPPASPPSWERSTPQHSAPQQHPTPAPQGNQQSWGQQPAAGGNNGWGSPGSSTGWRPDSRPGGQPSGQQGGQHGAPQGPPPGPPPSLTSQSLLRQTTQAPTRGWRRFVHRASRGSVNPGLSQAEIAHRAMVARVTTPVRGSNRIAVVSLKGGIGKTTTTCCLGLTLAHHRGDRVVALDANPDAGTLAERLTNVTDVTVRDLLAGAEQIRSFTDVSAYTSLAGRLQVLASDQDPALSEAFSEEEYTTVADILARYFNLILTDSGTGLLHSAMSGTLAIADSLVVVGAPSVDGASRASKTLDWLIAHGHEELVSRSVAVISSVRPNTGDVDMDMVREHFGARCRAVVEIPYDQHLVTGGLIDLDRVGEPARKAYLELAAHVADGFSLPPLQRRPTPASA
ncbi:MAG: hypothetical protein JWQ53_2807 [Klenkia sp.]|nr:hypothetical protein [Klenkia sp.]